MAMHFSDRFSRLLLIALLCWQSTAAFQLGPLQNNHHHQRMTSLLSQQTAGDDNIHHRDDDNHHSITRRSAVIQTATTASMLLTWLFHPAAAHAKKLPLSQPAAFDALTQALTSETGAVAQLTRAIENNNKADLLEMTKDMDQSLRKRIVTTCKYYVVDGDKGQALSNSVTFDLIGINKSARGEALDANAARKYLQELKDDLQSMLDMERKPLAEEEA